MRMIKKDTLCLCSATCNNRNFQKSEFKTHANRLLKQSTKYRVRVQY
jgi:hypothetical protein